MVILIIKVCGFIYQRTISDKNKNLEPNNKRKQNHIVKFIEAPRAYTWKIIYFASSGAKTSNYHLVAIAVKMVVKNYLAHRRFFRQYQLDCRGPQPLPLCPKLKVYL